MSKLERAC